MATPINAPLTSEIWHLSIDDLLEPLSEPLRLGGPGPFVINLSASSAPLSQPAKTFIAPDGACVYQIQRMEDRRPRYRLRLGPFVTEDEADAMLAIVRDVYPSALTATAESDDLKAITALRPKPESARTPSAALAHPVVSAPSIVTAPAIVAAPAVMPAPAVVSTLSAVPRTQTVMRPQPLPPTVSIPVLSDSVEPVRRAPPPVAPSVKAPILGPAKAAAPPVKPAAPPVKLAAPPVKPAAPPVKLAAPGLSNGAASPPRRAEMPSAGRPNLESTQTLRPLTPSELKDDQSARWYVIQLSLSGESFDPDSLPNLDIFNEYRLYSVAGLDQGRILHALRLGFFADEGAAAAVASYLGEFYEKPTVKRISVAERERFRDQRVEARKDIGATGRHAVIEITGERHIRDSRPRIATVTPLAPAAAFAQSTGTPARRGR